MYVIFSFFFNDTATTEIYTYSHTLSLHDALPISVRAELNLYDFLLRGEMPQIQLSDGDVIFVGPRESTIKVSGLAENANRFEFSGGQMPMSELIALAKPLALATHARVIRNRSEEHTSELQSLMRISYAVFCLKKKN